MISLDRLIAYQNARDRRKTTCQGAQQEGEVPADPLQSSAGASLSRYKQSFRSRNVGFPHSTRTARSAFSLLELMLALGLLGALLAVAWSLLGTYRNAEVRGWKLSHRVQTVRSARDWLEWDAQHLIISSETIVPVLYSFGISRTTPQPTGPKTAAIQPAKTHRFLGSAMGFTATIAPSLDPIPFLENLMSDTTQSERESSGLESLIGDQANGIAASNSPWPAETIDIEYRLTPMASSTSQSNLSSQSSALSGEMDDSQYVLTRTESIAWQSQAMESNPSERVLSSQDLYRQNDDSLLDSNQSVRESRLEGLTKVRFRYFDGSTWKSNWNSDQQGGLPCAIALGFDFPETSEIQLPSTSDSESTDEDGLMSEQLQTPEFPFAESTLESEPIAESSAVGSPAIMESSTSEVQIVVLVTNGISKSTAVEAASIQRARP
jgi:type II secretory pathway pseudopilin PulG